MSSSNKEFFYENFFSLIFPSKKRSGKFVESGDDHSQFSGFLEHGKEGFFCHVDRVGFRKDGVREKGDDFILRRGFFKGGVQILLSRLIKGSDAASPHDTVIPETVKSKIRFIKVGDAEPFGGPDPRSSSETAEILTEKGVELL